MAIFTFIAGQIEEQIQQFGRQADTCDRVVGNIRAGAQPIQNGAWIGKGAEAFKAELVRRVIPQMMELIAAITGFGGKLGNALNIMRNADKMVQGIVGQVAGIFEKIF